jgi:hypothetical protein
MLERGERYFDRGERYQEPSIATRYEPAQYAEAVTYAAPAYDYSYSMPSVQYAQPAVQYAQSMPTYATQQTFAEPMSYAAPVMMPSQSYATTTSYAAPTQVSYAQEPMQYMQPAPRGYSGGSGGGMYGNAYPAPRGYSGGSGGMYDMLDANGGGMISREPVAVI